LSYNENAVVARITPGPAAGARARVDLGPPGHGLVLSDDVSTSTDGLPTSIDVFRFPGTAHAAIRGTVPLGATSVTRTAAVDNPTLFFVEALRLALARRGIGVSRGTWDVDDLTEPPAAGDRRLIGAIDSPPLSALAGYAIKVSQNFYMEALLKTLGRADGQPGTAERGRQAVRATLAGWDIPADSVVQYDGSGLSRYNYVTASTMVAILAHVWNDEQLRGPFVAALPVAGHDGTLDGRMRETVLDRNVRAKTGTISNVRALSGYLTTRDGETLVFSMIANHFTAPSATVDAIVERALARLVTP
jgi:D-alanyl-D-alanine carboxypeptidase/D-alanyl-D-alanine-endopeptidase (penicillin-binding protein 4)